MSNRLSVNFDGSLLQLKAWLAEMPDNLASVLHTSFKAETQGGDSVSQLEDACRVAALKELQAGKKIAAIKAVRVVCEREKHRGFLGTLRGAKAFVEDLEFSDAASRAYKAPNL